MNDSYDPLFVGTISGVMWAKQYGLGFEFSWTGAEGSPALKYSDWEVSDSWLKMRAYTLGINFLYRFTNLSGDQLFEPYALAGPAFMIGSERISATASRTPVGVYEGFRSELLALGFAFGINTGMGTTVRIADKLRALVEVRWITNISDGTGDIVDEKEQAGFDSSLYSVVERPGFSFTGWRIDVGFQW